MNMINKKGSRLLLLTLAFYSFLPYIAPTSPYLFAIIILVGLVSYCVVSKQLADKSTYSNFDCILLLTFFIWQGIIILRGLIFNFSSIMEMVNTIVLNPYSLLALILPLVCFVKIESIDYHFGVRLLGLIGVIAIVLVVTNFNVLFRVDYSLYSIDESTQYATLHGIQSPIVRLIELTAFGMFIPVFIKKRQWRFFTICGMLALFISLFAARRGESALCLLLIIGGLSLYARNKCKNKFIIFILILGTLGGIYYFITSNLGSTFSLLGERFDVDNRTAIEVGFWYDMNQGLDLLLGRGLNGTYYFPMHQGDDWVVNRNIIETGYCYLVLIGGLVNLSLYCFIMLRSIYLGMFKSNNSYSRASALYILIYFFYLIPFGLPAFSLPYMFIWIGVRACLSEFRYYSDIEVNNLLFV